MEEDLKLLDQYATAAMQALITKMPFLDNKGEIGSLRSEDEMHEIKEQLAQSAYGYAKYMLIARGKSAKWLYDEKIKNTPKVGDVFKTLRHG